MAMALPGLVKITETKIALGALQLGPPRSRCMIRLCQWSYVQPRNLARLAWATVNFRANKYL